jgi:hypothetical protein
MHLQQAPDCAVISVDISQRTARTRRAVVISVVVLVINLPPRTPPSFFSSPSLLPSSILLLHLPLPSIKLVARRRC